ncbi:hypothetical protein CANTEDRAFT_116580, partial [Yamadazyma tenuis ATCC 10573]
TPTKTYIGSAPRSRTSTEIINAIRTISTQKSNHSQKAHKPISSKRAFSEPSKSLKAPKSSRALRLPKSLVPTSHKTTTVGFPTRIATFQSFDFTRSFSLVAHNNTFLHQQLSGSILIHTSPLALLFILMIL